jgi:hypothetical protein
VKVGDLVESTVDSAIGIITDLGNRHWDGRRYSFAHVQVDYPTDGRSKWELPERLEVISESR